MDKLCLLACSYSNSEESDQNDQEVNGEPWGHRFVGDNDVDRRVTERC